MRPAITFLEKPYNRLQMVDLLDESDEMKWKIFDYHNQKFVLQNIVDDRPFTKEGHAEFLQKLPALARKHYIVYFDGQPLGKFGWELVEAEKRLNAPGYYLFHEKDMMGGLGLLMVSFFYHYAFDVLKVRSIHHEAKRSNKNSVRLSKHFGNRVVKEDDTLIYFECTAEAYQARKDDVDALLREYFL